MVPHFLHLLVMVFTVLHSTSVAFIKGLCNQGIVGFFISIIFPKNGIFVFHWNCVE
uniref:Uncharacterized protein n=1 Tax=Anguilla anguilla TaxID=7936 RepID=A0A0E9R9A2_ANGAN